MPSGTTFPLAGMQAPASPQVTAPLHTPAGSHSSGPLQAGLRVTDTSWTFPEATPEPVPRASTLPFTSRPEARMFTAPLWGTLTT